MSFTFSETPPLNTSISAPPPPEVSTETNAGNLWRSIQRIALYVGKFQPRNVPAANPFDTGLPSNLFMPLGLFLIAIEDSFQCFEVGICNTFQSLELFDRIIMGLVVVA